MTLNKLVVFIWLLAGCNPAEKPEVVQSTNIIEQLLINEQSTTLSTLVTIYSRYNENEQLVNDIAWYTYVESERIGITPYLLASLVVTESWVDHNAVGKNVCVVREESGKCLRRDNAVGLGQVLSWYWEGAYPQCGEDLRDIATNLCYSARILKYYLIHTDGDVARALALYSGGAQLYGFTVMSRCARFFHDLPLEDLDENSECVYHTL